jgi:hypothetical protein
MFTIASLRRRAHLLFVSLELNRVDDVLENAMAHSRPRPLSAVGGSSVGHLTLGLVWIDQLKGSKLTPQSRSPD